MPYLKHKQVRKHIIQYEDLVGDDVRLILHDRTGADVCCISAAAKRALLHGLDRGTRTLIDADDELSDFSLRVR